MPKILKLTKPILLDGQEVRELPYDFDALTAADIHETSRYLKANGVAVPLSPGGGRGFPAGAFRPGSSCGGHRILLCRCHAAPCAGRHDSRHPHPDFFSRRGWGGALGQLWQVIGEITLCSSTSAADCLRLPLCDLFDLYAALIGLMERRAQDGQ